MLCVKCDLTRGSMLDLLLHANRRAAPKVAGREVCTLTKLAMASAMSSKVSMRTSVKPVVARRGRTSVVRPVAALDPNVVISGSTVALLSLGRFVFLPYQRREADFESSVGPKTTGTSFFDDLQKPASFVLTTKDPAGFNLIDVFAWGALGHAFGFLVLAISSLHNYGVNPWPAV